ncbi:MAG: hypothetical protein AAGI53_14095 [Planctomycetota bacterium]
MFRNTVLAIAAMALVHLAAPAFASHPQDGPHADLRLAIEDSLVRFSIGVNLAFLDEAIDVPRESTGEVSDAEATTILTAVREWLTAEATCVINGVSVEPEFERLEIFTDPDPGMVAIFENTGARGLIRATAVLNFVPENRTESVEVTWPTYPIDQLAERMETPGAVRPRMYFEAVFTANGKSSPARFTHAEPTIRWGRATAAASDPLRDLPLPVIEPAHSDISVITLAVGGAALAMLAFGATRRTTMPRFAGLTLAVVLGTGAFASHERYASQYTPVPLISKAESEQVFRALHESLYRAFDYTAESDIYDRLDLALAGDLLGDLYEQIRLSLLQAEEEMKIGVVTGLEPIETTIIGIDASGPDAQGRGFGVVHKWRVDGTVYHWGHSHTRSHEYEAAYRVTFTENGWRITEHELRSQRRIDPLDPMPAEEADPLQRVLEMLGRPDI